MRLKNISIRDRIVAPRLTANIFSSPASCYELPNQFRPIARRDMLRQILIAGVSPGLIMAAIDFANAQSIVSGNANANGNSGFGSAGPASTSGGGTCPNDGSPSLSTSGSTVFGYVPENASSIFFGQNQWNDGGTPRTICKLGFQMSLDRGTITGKTFIAQIFDNNGGTNFTAASPLATSNGVAGSQGWSSTMVRFSFPTPFLTTASHNYALVCSCGAVDASNGVKVYKTAASTLQGYPELFNASGTFQIGSGTDCVMEIYWLT